MGGILITIIIHITITCAAVDFQLTIGFISDSLQSVLIMRCSFTAASWSKNKCGLWVKMENFGKLQAVITVYRAQYGGEV